MAKRPTQAKDGPRLFEQQERALERRIRRQRALFIPKYVKEAASYAALAGPSQDRGYALVVRWADLESAGHLATHKETSIDTQFLDQLFGEGLGYQLKTKSPTNYNLEHKYAVSGVGIADAALGDFPAVKSPAVIIELKDARTDLDRDRFSGRTAVQQCWDYLNALPNCEWGIVSNFSTIRLYHRSKGTLNYEEFTLQELRSRARFDEFYALFERGGLLASGVRHQPRAIELLSKTEKRQKEVGDDLYESYRLQRLRLIDHLMRKEGKTLDRAIAIAQKLLDRIIFIAFCEDRDLLPENCLERAHTSIEAFSRVRNPRWHNFLGLFSAVDKGNPGVPPIDRFNGGLFADDPEIDELELDDEPWTTGFKGFGRYDFSEEVNVEVLGHLFERSITELEKLRVGGLFALKAHIEGTNGNGHLVSKGGRAKRKSSKAVPAPDDSPLSKMPKSAQRKRFGIYYTPPAFTGLIVERTVDVFVRDRFALLAKQYKVDPEARVNQDPKKLLAYWTACLEALKTVTVCDPACGSGAFLIRAYDAMDAHYKAVVHGLGGAGLSAAEVATIEDSVPHLILSHNLYGVDLSREGVEITQLALWIRSARKGKSLVDLSKHIIHGNSLVADTAVDPHALDWAKTFPHIFGEGGPGRGGGFSCVIGNPPWERVKVQDREFFSLTDPETAEAVNAADRRRRIAAMPKANPELHASYLAARDNAQKILDYARGSDRYPLTGKGDVNLYMLFAELARSLVAPDGLVGILVPSGIATDDTTKEFFSGLMEDKRLISLYDFENRDKVFEDVDGRFKFTALVFGGKQRKTERADFVFFAHNVEETTEANELRHIPLTAADMALLNPNTKTCPIFRTRRDAELTKTIYKRVPILIDRNRKQGGNPWGVQFFTMFHQTNDAEHFVEAKVWNKKGYALAGNVYVKGNRRALPLYEAKMVQAFDHRAASVVVDDENWVRQGQKAETSLVQHQNPEFAVLPRWWVTGEAVAAVTQGRTRDWLLCYKDITSATNERTMIAAFTPWVAMVNSAPIMFVDEGIAPRREACLLGNLDSFVFDFVARQKVGSVHLNYFIVEQLPTLLPDTYADKCPWSKLETLEQWFSERVLKLSCTAEDMIPLAKACDFKGSRGDGVHLWKEKERAELRAELDAAYFILYGIERADVEYILSTFAGTGFIVEDERGDDGSAWRRGGQGDMILEAYDHLSGLSSIR
ncbi:MAG: DNA methyltransferase [Planctomycetota bacterium]|nr:DNA methyltransferase [Planctomycetota bacterium]